MRDPEWHHGDVEELPYTEASVEPEDSLEWIESGSGRCRDNDQRRIRGERQHGSGCSD